MSALTTSNNALSGQEKKKKRNAKKRNEALTAYVFMLPWIFVFVVFIAFAIIYAFYLSFTKYNLLNPPEWVGIDVYAKAICFEALWTAPGDVPNCDPLFITKALPNTILYTAIVVPVQTVISLVLAFALDQKLRFRRMFRTIFYLPSVTSSVVISLIFVWLFSPAGVVNQILGIDVNWLNQTSTAFYVIMLLNIFTTSGSLMLIFLAGLQDIPQTLYEAASVDGANKFQMFRLITVPMLRPVIFFVVTTGVIGCFQVFDQIFVMTAGGPLDSTTTVAYLIYKWAFRDTTVKMGQAAALAFILAVIIMVVTLIQRRFLEGSGNVEK